MKKSIFFEVAEAELDGVDFSEEAVTETERETK